ncbi:MAG: ATP-binding protein, partial [Clostridia bacterium]
AIDEALQHINRNVSEHTIAVVSEDDLIMAEMDVRLIVQVIINIVDNAIKYTPVGSEITISVSKKGDNVLTEIADTGSGLSSEAKEHIFEMFYMADTKVA